MLDDAIQELKRADHSLYISLKYTRTVDVMKSTIHRLVNTFDNAIIHALETLKSKKRIEELPLTPISRAETLRKSTRQVELLDFLNFYFFLRSVDKAEYTKREEYRKHITLIVMHDDNVVEITVPDLDAYYRKTKEFVLYIKKNYK